MIPRLAITCGEPAGIGVDLVLQIAQEPLPANCVVIADTEILKNRDGHWFWSTIWESRNIYRDVFIVSILINIFAISTPLFTRLVYDKIVPNLAFDSLWVLAVGVSLVFLFDFLLRKLRYYFIDVASKKLDLQLSAKIFSRVMGIRLEARPLSVGAFANNLQSFEAIREFITSATISALVDLPFTIIFLLAECLFEFS